MIYSSLELRTLTIQYKYDGQRYEIDVQIRSSSLPDQKYFFTLPIDRQGRNIDYNHLEPLTIPASFFSAYPIAWKMHYMERMESFRRRSERLATVLNVPFPRQHLFTG